MFPDWTFSRVESDDYIVLDRFSWIGYEERVANQSLSMEMRYPVTTEAATQ